MTTPPVPAEPAVTPADVATWLRTTVDLQSAQMFIDAAMLACRAVVAPIPAAAGPIVTAVAARAYSNPTGASTSAAGPFTAGWAVAGVYLTDDERVSLLAAAGQVTGAGGGGAFTIDPTPATAGVPWQPWSWDEDYAGNGGFR